MGPRAHNIDALSAHMTYGILSPTLPYYTCMSLMEVDPEQSDTLMHSPGTSSWPPSTLLCGERAEFTTWKRES